VVFVVVFVVVLCLCMFVVMPISDVVDNNSIDSEDHHKATATLVRLLVNIPARLSLLY